MRILDALADIFLGSACPGCQSPGLRLCENCRQQLRGAWNRVLPCGLEVIFSAEYVGTSARLVTAFKDEQCWSLGSHFATAMRSSIQVFRPGWLLEDSLIVPVPSRPAIIRKRGLDHTWAIAKALAASNPNWHPRRLLRSSGGADQAQLDQGSRWLNRAASFTARQGTGQVVLVDDLVTTGATLTAAAHALGARGWTVIGATTLANTRRRSDDAPGCARKSHNP